MTFLEAKEYKKGFNSTTIEKNGKVFTILITPKDGYGFEEYLDAYYMNNLSDESAIQYSKNGQFKVTGIKKGGIPSITWEDL